jgi:hypothetical protein
VLGKEAVVAVLIAHEQSDENDRCETEGEAADVDGSLLLNSARYNLFA